MSASRPLLSFIVVRNVTLRLWFAKKQKKLTLQSGHPIIPQPVLGQHTSDRPSQDLATTPFRHHSVHGDLLQATRSCGVAVVLFVESLLAGRVQIVAANGDDVIAAVGRGIVDGFVLAHEGDGDFRGHATEG